jgi:hypothetical protein
MTIEDMLDRLNWMRDRLAEEKALIERNNQVTFKELEQKIKDDARVTIDVGEVVHGNFLEVYFAPGRVVIDNKAVNTLIKLCPALEAVLKRRTDPIPSIRRINKSRPSRNGDRQKDTQVS